MQVRIRSPEGDGKEMIHLLDAGGNFLEVEDTDPADSEGAGNEAAESEDGSPQQERRGDEPLSELEEARASNANCWRKSWKKPEFSTLTYRANLEK